MQRKINIRIDDVCPDMNFDNFCRLRDLLLHHKVIPLMGIIPDNKDCKLAKMRTDHSDAEAWAEIYRLYTKEGWGAALHGHDHIYRTDSSGILNINKRSEFAGLDYQTQSCKIVSGKEKLRELGFATDIFMAPAHSFDETTIRVLLESGFRYITDGKGVYPYRHKGITMIPAPCTNFYDFPFGIYSVGLHPNTMQEKDFRWLENYLQKNTGRFISFSEAAGLSESYASKTWTTFANVLSDAYMKTYLFAAKVFLFLRSLVK